VLNWLYDIVTRVVLALHSVLAPLFGDSSGVTWGLSVFFLTILVRILLFPLFVKQIKSQRAMSELAPRIKDLQTNHKNDRERLGQETMALYKEHGVNPLMGCLPLVAQAPVFYALFHVLRYISNHGGSATPSPGFKPEYGWTVDLLQSAGHAHVFGVPLALGFRTADKASLFEASATTVKVVTVIAIIVMASTTFLTQRQLMARNAKSGNPMASQQKMLLYVLPPLFALFGLNFQMGVLIYWVTSNVWSLGQQHFVIKAMPIVQGGAAGGAAGGGAGGGGGSGGGSSGGPGGGGVLSGLGKRAKKEPPPPPPPPVVIRRQQSTRPPKSKRDGRRPQRPGSPR
jgi:YidC/Oxa1 family membrane protein insertase